MMIGLNPKVNSEHLKRNAYLYVRQSTPRQVLENTESAKRQYGLRQRAAALGWPMERIIVVDSDQGHSGASVADREGFQKLVAEVGMGRAGIVLGLEVSRLARNNADWHRLLEICALADTLILDEDGVYDPKNFNDRLLLGLKGTMSEAELHVLYARMRGGILSKARRGELTVRLPVGLVYDDKGEVILDPDTQVQQSLRLLFATFRREGSVWAAVKSIRQQGLLFPKRLFCGPRKGDLLWVELDYSQAVGILRSPRYAGAYVFGRTRIRKKMDGSFKAASKLPREQWHTLLPNAHPGYIAWEEYEANQRRLDQNARFRSSDRRNSPPREGPALLQGIVLCGRCGERMMVHYRKHGVSLIPEYFCRESNFTLTRRVLCQQILGGDLDVAIGKLLVEAMTPMALEVALGVQAEIQSRLQEADRLRRAQVDRARYEVQLAQRRYMQVDPANRLVADALETDWNEKLRILKNAQEEYERQGQSDRSVIDAEHRERILALATDFPKLWENPNTAARERKRIVRLMLEDVTLIKDKEITAHVRFKGGATRTISIPRPLTAAEMWKTSPEIVAEIDRLLEQHTTREIANILNERGLSSGTNQNFTGNIVIGILQRYGLKPRRDRLRVAGLLTQHEVAEILGISQGTVSRRCKRGLIRGHVYNDRGDSLYENPGSDPAYDARGRLLQGRKTKIARPSSNERRCGTPPETFP
jgi:DNA invertase Pin-like site-specific DNA recombinase